MLSDSSDEEYTTKDLFNPIEEVSVLADTSYQERDQKLESNLVELTNLFELTNLNTFVVIWQIQRSKLLQITQRKIGYLRSKFPQVV